MNAEVTSPPRTAIVTGAGSGIGRASALALLNDGWQVVLAGRRREPLEAVAAESGAGERAMPYPADVSDASAVAALFAAAVERFGRVDLLFNNAGLGNPPGPFEDWTPEQWRAMDPELAGKLLQGIAAFELTVTDWQCKLKLNQHRKEAHAAMHAAYAAGGLDERALGGWMEDLGMTAPAAAPDKGVA